MHLSVIHSKIFEIRGQKVMLDFDIAFLYEVETRILNQSVKRNLDKFPKDFMFRLTENEWELMQSQFATVSNSDNSSQIVMTSNTISMRSQFVTASQKKRNKNVTPFAFTEHGVTMLASVLRSKKAIAMNIAIVRAFTAMRHFANSHKDLFDQINDLRKEMESRFGEHDIQLAAIYDALENLLDKKQEEEAAKEKWENRKRIGFKK